MKRFLLSAGWCGLALLTSHVPCRAADWDGYRLYVRALIEERHGRFATALPLYAELVRRAPDSIAVRESLAESALRAGRPDLAQAAAREVVALDTASASGYILLGRTQLAQGGLKEAQVSFDAALRLDPGNVEALGWATSHREIAEPQTARALFESFLKENPEEDLVRARLADLEQKQGDLAAAESSWKKLLDQNPENADAWLALAGIYDVRGDTVSAVSAYENYAALVPDNPQVLVRLGQLAYAQGRFDEAEDYFERAARFLPADENLCFWRALVAQEQKNWTGAAAWMGVVAKTNRDPGVMIRLASYLSRDGRPKEARRALHQLQKSQPTNPDFMYYLGLAYADDDQPRSAIRWFDRVVRLDSTRVDAHFQLALQWDRRRRFSRAVDHLKKTIELDPNHHVALNYLGYSWADRGENLEEALALIQRAVALDPENLAYRDSLGWVYFRLGRRAEAETALSSAVFNADDAVVWRHYGDVLAQGGKEDQARRAWEESWLLDPEDRETRKRLGPGGEPVRVTPLSAPRTLLKRVEGNFLQLRGLSGLAAVSGQAGPLPLRGSAFFHYGNPDRFRFEILGPFFAPQAVLVASGGRSQWTPSEAGGIDAGPWLSVLGQVLSGKFFDAFDDPAVEVQRDGGRLVYRSSAGTVRVDVKGKSLVDVVVPSPGGGTVRLAFSEHREVDGLLLPGRVDVASDIPAFRLLLRFSRLAVNPPLDSTLFRLTP